MVVTPTINPACELCQGRRVKMDLRDAVLSHLPNPSLRACRANLIIVLTRSCCSDGELSLGVGIFCPAMSGVLLNDEHIHEEVALMPCSRSEVQGATTHESKSS